MNLAALRFQLLDAAFQRGYASDVAALKRGIEQLEAQGCQVHNYYDPMASYQRFGGTKDGCVAQFNGPYKTLMCKS